MSHITKIQVEVSEDLDVMDKTATRLGMKLNEGQTTFRSFYAKNDGRCLHALSVLDNPNAYEIGLAKRSDGKPGFELLWDDFAGGQGLVEKVGPGATLLKQAYAVETANKQMESEGFWAEETILDDGTVEVEYERRTW